MGGRGLLPPPWGSRHTLCSGYPFPGAATILCVVATPSLGQPPPLFGPPLNLPPRACENMLPPQANIIAITITIATTSTSTSTITITIKTESLDIQWRHGVSTEPLDAESQHKVLIQSLSTRIPHQILNEHPQNTIPTQTLNTKNRSRHRAIILKHVGKYAWPRQKRTPVERKGILVDRVCNFSIDWAMCDGIISV